ncbi:MAG: hypothetical protein ACREVA_02425 [Burkholderiales bacterium]
MLKRPRFPKTKPVLYISDVPTQSEVDTEQAYSSSSNLALQDKLHRVGITTKEVHFTYLFYDKKKYSTIQEHFRRANSVVDIEPQSFILTENISITLDKSLIDTNYCLWFVDNIYVSEYILENIREILHTIEQVRPKIIIVAGKWALYLLVGMGSFVKTRGTSKSNKPFGSLNNYRGSITTLNHNLLEVEAKTIPVYIMLPVLAYYRIPERAVLYDWDFRKLGKLYTATYIAKAKDIEITDTYSQNPVYILKYLGKLQNLLQIEEVVVAIDIETQFYTIDCVGFMCEALGNITIAFANRTNPILLDEYTEILYVSIIRNILLHKNIRIVGQNYNYDAQFLWDFWLADTTSTFDTMTAWHCLYNPLVKGLSTIASICCIDYKQWKDMTDWKEDTID